ncbi:MAG: endonuclease/exonuclease/phosphatase family protein [Prevotellaceae bacterium]|jgi:endonuclease/exonuclease/phosphatase family metal-dependent hydrolase|nr:endonuclease/exonuclease/phosphatase family protein [Prevotellaceae bacterium]
MLGSLEAQELRFFKNEKALRIMSYNVRNAKGMDMKTDYARVANVINGVKPGVVAIQEVDKATKRSKGIDVLAELALLTDAHGTFGAAINYDGGGKYGVGILSKEPPLNIRSIALPGSEEARTVLIAEFEDYVLACTHWSLTEGDRIASITIVNELAKQYNKPFFLAGDFNMTPESTECFLLAESWEALNNLNENTFPSDNPDRCIDYIFLYSEMNSTVNVLQNRIVDEPIASDHRPIFVDVELYI